jgi:murein L,D-transpeptidase YcbB/YkuD
MSDWMRRNDSINPATMSGMARNMSMNEVLSRAYNISRGMVSPLYVTSEFAIRAASASSINLLQLTAQNEDAARIVAKMFENPELVTRQDIDTFDQLLQSFVYGTMGRNDMFLPEAEELFLLPEEKTDEDEQ